MPIPEAYNWGSLVDLRGRGVGDALHCILLRELGQGKGHFGADIHQEPKQDPRPGQAEQDHRLMIDAGELAHDGGEGQGRHLRGAARKECGGHQERGGTVFYASGIDPAMVECLAPEPLKTIADPACGTGGFFLAAYDYLVEHHQAGQGAEQVPEVRDLLGGMKSWRARADSALMNLFLHNIGDIDSDNFISPADALIASSSDHYDYIPRQSAVWEKEQFDVHECRG
jgi:type I restriction enzyme M protein